MPEPKISPTLISFLKSSLANKSWDKVGIRHHHGIALPLSSLHSKDSCGIGEFYDLMPLMKWCKKVGFNVIQLLPLNDSGLDSSPYNNLSAFALNPLYLSINQLKDIKSVDSYQRKINSMKEENASSKLKHLKIRQKKIFLLREYFSLKKYDLSKNEEFSSFKKEQEYWLFPYTLFKAIKKLYPNHTWLSWPKEFRYINNIPHLKKKFSEDINFYSYLQYLCYKQLLEVKQYAKKSNILLKGDLPILISKDSADSWFYKNFFSLSMSVGAPPDVYNEEGQNWAFPLFKWNEIKKDHFQWHKNRLRYFENFYDIYRIDHIAGLFRLWIMNNDEKGSLGRFIPSKEEEALIQGKEILSVMIQSSTMLPIGEDLGNVPTSFKNAMNMLGVCGTKILRWERNWKGKGEFIEPSQYSPISLTSVSSHDTDPLLLWWRNSPLEARLYAKSRKWTYKPCLSKEQHIEILTESHNSQSLFHINLIGEYLSIYPELVSHNLKYERINIPGTISSSNWRYKIKPSIEDLLINDKLNTTISDLLKQ